MKENKKLEELTEREADWLQTDLDQTKRQLTRSMEREANLMKEIEDLKAENCAWECEALNSRAKAYKFEGVASAMWMHAKAACQDGIALEDMSNIAQELTQDIECLVGEREYAEGPISSELSVLSKLLKAAERAGDNAGFREDDEHELLDALDCERCPDVEVQDENELCECENCCDFSEDTPCCGFDECDCEEGGEGYEGGVCVDCGRSLEGDDPEDVEYKDEKCRRPFRRR